MGWIPDHSNNSGYIYFPHISPKTGGRKPEDLFNFLASLFHNGLLDVVSVEHAITRQINHI